MTAALAGCGGSAQTIDSSDATGGMGGASDTGGTGGGDDTGGAQGSGGASTGGVGTGGVGGLVGCGNGKVDVGEACDDGNRKNGDGCQANCMLPGCGDGILDAGEACDDGNAFSGDGCQVNCALPGCGDGSLDAGEACDDGNNVSGDGCSATCVSDETCGNGIKDTSVGEQCDDGDLVSGDGCQADCLLPVCGDGTVDPNEECDDGNTAGGDGCSADCGSDETCGNGVVDAVAGETCDDGNLNPNDGCGATCKVPGCGDGVKDAGEACDDGNTYSYDGCSADCSSNETCGNGHIDARPVKTVAVWETGGGTPATIATYLKATGGFTTVDSYSAQNVVLATLTNYDALLFLTNGGGDPNNGNVLADYADTGRGLVLGTFSWANQGGNTLAGRIITDVMSPFVLEGSSLYSNVTMASNDGSDYFAGVSTLSGHYHDNVKVVAGAVLRGSWSDGEPLVATKGNVTGVNLYADEYAGSLGGDYKQLFVNALKHSRLNEQCDDGNTTPGDGCNASCVLEAL